MTKEELIAKVQEAARRRDKKFLSLRQFKAEAGVATHVILRLFGSWSNLCAAAGISGYPRKLPLSDEDIFGEMRRTFLDLGCVPSLTTFESHFRYSQNIFVNRGWSWKRAKALCGEWAQKNHPDFPYLDQLAGRAAPTSPPRSRHVAPTRAVHPTIGTRYVGEPLDFGAMINAPANEMGVVALFAMVAERLGYRLELFDRTFPDCEARRRVAGGRWQRVRIEFEFRSSNFIAHRHERAGCDVLVCWIADWRPDDIEVIELRSVIETLRANPARKNDEGNDEAAAGNDEAGDEGKEGVTA